MDAHATLPFQLDTPAFKKAWEDWVAYRKERRLPRLVSRSVQAQWDRLADYGPEIAVATINESIAQNWQGLFPGRSALPGAANAGRTGGTGGDRGGFASLGALQLQLSSINEQITDIVFPGGCAHRVQPTGEKLARYEKLIRQRDAIKKRIDQFAT